MPSSVGHHVGLPDLDAADPLRWNTSPPYAEIRHPRRLSQESAQLLRFIVRKAHLRTLPEELGLPSCNRASGGIWFHAAHRSRFGGAGYSNTHDGPRSESSFPKQCSSRQRRPHRHSKSISRPIRSAVEGWLQAGDRRKQAQVPVLSQPVRQAALQRSSSGRLVAPLPSYYVGSSVGSRTNVSLPISKVPVASESK
jgi:hypothetical protein